jgi:TrmH family RNA methyltransferase
VRRISSRSNPLVARARDVARGHGPDGVVLLDGEHLVDEALRSATPLEVVALTEARAHATGIVDRVTAAGIDAVQVPEAVMRLISPVREPSGVVALALVGSTSLDRVCASSSTTGPPLVVVLDGIQDAGNVGAIVRTAEGCGATGIVATSGTADPFGWKALRGSMGSALRLPIAREASTIDTLDALRRRGLTVLATVPRGGTLLGDSVLQGPIAIVLGGEGPGLGPQVLDAADQRLSIPMRAPVESFNVAVTAALILYEAARQRDSHVALPRS